MATEEQQVLEALRALSSIPNEFHWFCNITEFEDASQQPECVLTTEQRIEKAQILLKLFAVDDHSTLPWLKEQLMKQLSRCASCVETFHAKKREMFIEMQREYDLEEVQGFFERLTQFDIERILPSLGESDRTVRGIPPPERRLGNLIPEALYAMYDVLCDPALLDHEPIGRYFRFTFSAIQQRKSKLRVEHVLPAMVAFLFDEEPGLQEWAIYSCKRQLPTMDPAIFEKVLLPFLTKAIRHATDYASEDNFTRFFSGALVIAKNASREVILNCICGASEDLIKITLNHAADKAKYLETVLLLLGELMRKLRYDFWDAAAPAESKTFVEYAFGNPQLELMFQDGSSDEYKATLEKHTSWIIPFAETLRPSNRPQICSNLLFQLLKRFQGPKNHNTFASSVCLKEGMKVLRMSLDDLSKEGISSSVNHILCRTTLKLASEHIGPVKRVITEEPPSLEVRNNWLEARTEARVILQCTLVLDCKVIYEDYRLLSKDKALPGGIPPSYFSDLYETVVNRFESNDVIFAMETLASLLDLVGLEKIRIQEDKTSNQDPKSNEPNLRTEKLEFNKSLGLINAAVGELLNRVSEYEPENLIQILNHPKAGRFVIASLFSPENGWYLPGVDIIKQAFNTIGKVEGLGVMLANHFDTAIEALMWAIRRVTMLRNFGPMPRLVKTCGYINQILCDSPDGLLLQEGKFTTEAEKSKLTRYWTYQWDFLGVIFEETLRFQKTQDRGALVEFTRDTMEFADMLFSSFPAYEHAITPSIPESAFEANSQKISKSGIMLLQFGNRNIYKIAMWLRLRDEPLLRLCHGLLCKILKQLANANIPVDPEGVARLMKFATRGNQGKYQTNMTEQQKADLRVACGEPAVIEKPHVRKPDAKKQTTLAQWTAPVSNDEGPSPVKKEPKAEVVVISEDEDVGGDIPDEDMLAALERSEKTYQQEKQKRLQKIASLQASTKARPTSISKTTTMTKPRDVALERARADVAERIRLRKEKEAAMQSKVGSALQNMNIKPTDPSKTTPTVIGDETSSEEEDEDVDDDDGTGLFALATKARKTTVMLEGPHPGFRQPVSFTVQKQQRSAADLRARLTPDLSPLYRRILPWDFFHDSDFPPASDAKDYTMVTSTFGNVSQYRSTFEPLLMLECWNQFRKAKEENSFTVFSAELATRMNADNFVELHMTMDQTEFASQKISLGESDILLLSTAPQPLSSPSDPNCLTRVVGITRKRTVVEISLRCLPSPQMLPALKVKAKYRAVKILSLTPLEREYGALLSLMYYDLLDEILHARPTRVEPPPEERLHRTIATYQVNVPQAKAICAATDNEGFTLIQGPPGSGKTKTVIGIVGSILTPNNGMSIGSSGVAAKASKKLLVCAPSNAAVDELVIRFMQGIRTSKGENSQPNIVRLGRSEAINVAVKSVTLEELVDTRLSASEASKKATNGAMGDPAQLREEMNKLLAERDAIRAAKDDAFAEGNENAIRLQQEERALTEKIRMKGRQIDAGLDAQNTDRRNHEILRRKIQQEIMDSAQIICATLSGAGHEMLKGLNVEFDTVVIDEAAQSIELSALIPLKYGCTKCILVGDPKQLPPTVLSRDAARYMYEQSLFVRMQKNHPEDVHLLSIQYRMHPDISRFPSQQFYDSELEDGENMEKLRRRVWHNSTLFGPYRFFDIQGQETSGKGHSLVNHQEVTAAILLYRRLLADFPEQDFRGLIGVLTPYKQQLSELKRRFQNEFGGKILDTIDFNTTDAFQGREREIIIFSCVRASPSGGVGFLSDIRRMNVGLTRAKSSLFVLGHAQSLLRNEFWGKLVQDAKARGIYTEGNAQTLFGRTTRILPVAMDIDSPDDISLEKGITDIDMSLDSPPDHIKKESTSGIVRQEFGSGVAIKQELPTPDPRKRPGTVAPKPGPRKQQALGQGDTPAAANTPPSKSNSGPMQSAINKNSTIPLGRPSPMPIMPPASLIPPRYRDSDASAEDSVNAPFCYKCGNTGHVQSTCLNPRNPAKVDFMKKNYRGDPHAREIPAIQSSLQHDEQPHPFKRTAEVHNQRPAKRREMDGRIPIAQSDQLSGRSALSNNPKHGKQSGASPATSNDRFPAANSAPGLPPPPPQKQPHQLASRTVPPPKPKKAADPFIRKKEKRPRPPPSA